MGIFNNHVHSEFSNVGLGFPDATNKIEKLLDTAYGLGLSGIALTDHECLTGHIQAWKYYKSMQLERPFKLALGNEIYLMSESEYAINRDNSTKESIPYYHFVLTALDTMGHEQLRKLSTRAWERSATIKGVMRRPTYYSDIEEVIGVEPGHVIASSACLGSHINHKILEWKLKDNDDCKVDIHDMITWCMDIFGRENFYLEIQPCHSTNTEQTVANTTLWDLAQVYGLRLIATTDAHYYTKDTAFIHKTLLQSKDGDREVDAFYQTTYLMSDNELRGLLRNQFNDGQIDWILENSMDICNRVQDYELEHKPMIPEIPRQYIEDFEIKHTFKKYYSSYPYFAYYAKEVSYIHDRYFFYRIECALQEKIVDRGLDIETYIHRCDLEFKELKIISENFNSSMASYYSTFKNIIEIIWSSNSLSMPSRGSAMGFLTSYLLDITQIDPVPLGEYAPYWRHLSHERGVEIADIDNDSQASKRADILENLKKYFGYDKVLSVSNISRLTSKTAIERSVKGLHLNDDLAGYLKSLVPVERGQIWSINDCLYGNEKEHRKPVAEFVKEVNKYDHLIECIQNLEGLAINRGIHASGIIITNTPYTDTIAAMRSPNGVMCTCYDLHDVEYCGVVKVDLLTVQAADKIETTMRLLAKYGHIEPQEDLKSTYWKYLHPDVLQYDGDEMWDIIQSVYSVFQFDTNISVKALNQTNPKSVMDLSAANSLLRLQAGDGEQPLETYRRYKSDLKEWEKDCLDYSIDHSEMEVLRRYLSDSYMMADSQEKVMLLSMDKEVAGFGLKEANLLRKGIAKKSPEAREKSRLQFYEWGEKLGTRTVFLDYIWNEVFGKSFGYSFSQLHSYAYSVIALQELNLNYFYPSVYWNCACLTVESNSFDESENSTNKTTNYGKMAKAIYKMMGYGTAISPPSINHSDNSFTPIEAENRIVFGLGGISGINSDIAKEIIDHRPYESFEDFYQSTIALEEKSLIKPSKMIKLIKAGCFDEFTKDRVSLAKRYVTQETTLRESLTLSNVKQCIQLGITSIPETLIRAFKYKQYVLSKEFLFCNDKKYKTKKHYIVESQYALPYFEEHLMSRLKEEQDYYYQDDYLIVVDKSLEKALSPEISKLKECLSNPNTVKEFNEKWLENQYLYRVKNEDINKWSFETTSFYHNGGHELAGIDFERYNLSHFKDLPEEPVFIKKQMGGRSWHQYNLFKICGVVVDRNDNKHMIDLLTPDNEVVSVKFNGGQYSWYKQTLSDVVDDEKIVHDTSWLSRGELLMVCGYRIGEDFRAKRYKRSVYQHTLTRILNVDKNKNLELQFEREETDETDI